MLPTLSPSLSAHRHGAVSSAADTCGNLPRLAEWSAAPKVTAEELEQEKAKISLDARSAVEADVFGISEKQCSKRRLSQGGGNQDSLSSTDEDDEDVDEEAAVALAISQLCNIAEERSTADSHVALLEAKKRKLLTKKHLIMFLQWSEFDVEVAAERLVFYWEERVRLFQERAFLPLLPRIPETTTGEKKGDAPSEGALTSEDGVAFSFGLFRHVPGGKDDHGRHIFFYDVSRQDKSKYTRDSLLRVVWCTMETPFRDDIEGQQKGYIILMTNEKASFAKFDRKTVRELQVLLRDVLPLRQRATHLCYSPRLNTAVVLPLFLFLLGKEARLRFIVHSGTRREVVPTLESYGIPKEKIPTDLGGVCPM